MSGYHAFGGGLGNLNPEKPPQSINMRHTEYIEKTFFFILWGNKINYVAHAYDVIVT